MNSCRQAGLLARLLERLGLSLSLAFLVLVLTVANTPAWAQSTGINGGGPNGGGGGGGGSGTVTAVNTTVPAPLTGTGCSYTTSGTCAITWTAAQTANQFLATPNGSTGAVSLRTIVLADLPSGLPTGAANPTSSIGLTAINGSATTFMRSDAAPVLSLAIAPNFASPWTTSPWNWSNAEPRLALTESDQGTDLKNWDWDVQAGVFCLRTRTDADGAGVNAECFTRGTTTALANIMFGNATNNPAFQFLGTGTVTLGGGLSTNSVINGGRFQATASAVPSNGIYLPAANTLGFASNTTNRLSIDSTGAWLVGGSAGTAGQTLTSAGAGAPPTWATNTAGSFTGTLTGMSAATTATCNYTISGGVVNLTCNAGAAFTGTSNATTMTLTGAPAAIFPTAVRAPPYMAIEDNTTIVSGNLSISTSAVITFHLVVVSGTTIPPNQPFTSTGTKGLLAGWYVSYPL